MYVSHRVCCLRPVLVSLCVDWMNEPLGTVSFELTPIVHENHDFLSQDDICKGFGFQLKVQKAFSSSLGLFFKHLQKRTPLSEFHVVHIELFHLVV